MKKDKSSRQIVVPIIAGVLVFNPIYATEKLAQLSSRQMHQAMDLLERATQETMAIDAADDDSLGFNKTSLLLEIGQLYKKAGDSTSANTFLREAETIANKFNRPEFYGLLAIGQARAGYLQQALEAAKKLSNESYSPIPTTDYIFGRYDTRLVAQYTLLKIIIDEQLSKRNVKGALAAAAMLPERINGRRLRDTLYKKIVLAQWRWGDISAAREIIRFISEPWIKDELLQDLINIQLENNDIEGAIQFLQRVYYPTNKIQLLIKVAIAQAKQGDREGSRRNFNDAITIASGFTHDLSLRHFTKIRALCDIAVGQAEAGDPSARNTLKSANPRMQLAHYYKDARLSYFAIAQARCGLLQEALQTTESIQTPWTIAYTLASIAAVQAEEGDPAEARKLFQKAVDAANKIKDRWPRDRTLLSIVEKCIEKDKPNIGLQIARSIESDNIREEALFKIVEWYTKQGEIEQGKQVRNEIKIDHWQRQTNKSIIYVMTQSGNFSSAFEIAKTMDGPEEGEVMNKLIEGQIKAGDFPGAILTAQIWHTSGYTDRALGLVATAQAKAGDLDGALALGSNEKEPLRKVYIWLGAAKGLLIRKSQPIE
jgi:tetratricopeptide (TPR) repeat protein